MGWFGNKDKVKVETMLEILEQINITREEMKKLTEEYRTFKEKITKQISDNIHAINTLSKRIKKWEEK